MDDQPIEVRFRHRQGELARHMLRNMFHSQGWIWVLIAVLFILAAALVLLLALLDAPSTARMGTLVLSVGALAVLVLALTVAIARLNARRQLTSSKELSGELLYRFHQQGYEYKSEFATAQVAWGALHSAIERDDAFVLCPSKAHFVLLPKRGFADGAARRRFRRLLQESLGAKAQLRAGESRRKQQ